MSDAPHAARPFRLGRLKNGNRAGNPNTALKCGAKTRSGAPCRSPAMACGRCRMHGGSSTGPRTAEGAERSRRANWKHGRRSDEYVAQHRAALALVRKVERLLRQIGDG